MFQYSQSTFQAFYFFESVLLDGISLEENDWVGAFNGDICIGARRWNISNCNQGICDIPLMGSDGEDYSIAPEEIIIEEQAIGDYSIVTNQKFTLGVFTVLSDSLIKEGIVRDIVRHIQNIRKEFNFNVEDRIDVLIEGSYKINDALIDNKSYFLNEVLAVSFNDKSLNFNNSKNVKSNGEEVIISIKKNL